MVLLPVSASLALVSWPLTTTDQPVLLSGLVPTVYDAVSGGSDPPAGTGVGLVQTLSVPQVQPVPENVGGVVLSTTPYTLSDTEVVEVLAAVPLLRTVATVDDLLPRRNAPGVPPATVTERSA